MRKKTHDPKLAALLEHGAVHAHPEQIRDPLFLADEFFDPRDLVQVRYDIAGGQKRIHLERFGGSTVDPAPGRVTA